MASARAYATKHARELKAAICEPHVQDLTGWTMTVVDANGKIVFNVSFELKLPRPRV